MSQSDGEQKYEENDEYIDDSNGNSNNQPGSSSGSNNNDDYNHGNNNDNNNNGNNNGNTRERPPRTHHPIDNWTSQATFRVLNGHVQYALERAYDVKKKENILKN